MKHFAHKAGMLDSRKWEEVSYDFLLYPIAKIQKM